MDMFPYPFRLVPLNKKNLNSEIETIILSVTCPLKSGPLNKKNLNSEIETSQKTCIKTAG